MATFQDYLSELTKTTRKPIVRIELLRQDETPLSVIPLSDLRVDGSLSINNKNGARRSIGFTLDNVSKKYFPDIDGAIWLFRKFKLYLGLMVNGEEYVFPSGVFVFDNPTVTSDGSVQISGLDKFSLLDDSLAGALDSIVIINAGTTIRNALKTVMTIANDPKDIIIDNNLASLTLPYQIIHEEGSTLGDIILEIADAYSANCYYNEEGSLVFEKDTSDTTKGSIWTFTDGVNETNYQGGNVDWKFSDVVNSILCIGDNINGAIATGRVRNNDLLSPTSIPNLGFERVKVIHDNIIYNNTLAVERGKYELKRATALLTSSNLSSIPIYHLDVDKVVEIYDGYLNFNGKRCLIDSITMPLSNGSMSLSLVDTFETVTT